MADSLIMMRGSVKHQTSMQDSSKGKPPWLSLMEQAQQLRVQAMKRPGMKQVDVALMAGAIVLTCYRDGGGS